MTPHLCNVDAISLMSLINVILLVCMINECHPWVMNEHHVLTLGASMCMIDERHCHIIGMYD